MQNRKKILIVLSLILLVIFPIDAHYIYGYYFYDGSDDIQKTTIELINNISSDEDKSIAILNWERKNIDRVYGKQFINRFPFLIMKSASGKPSWVFFSKYGTCGDFAELFSEMSNYAGIENRLVFCPGEDHEWAEVNINGTWKNADAVWSNLVYDDKGYYERNWSNVSRVYYRDPITDEEVDITENYSQVGKLIVKINDSVEAQNTKIVIQSMYKSDREQNPKNVLSMDSNLNGTNIFKFGENTYKIIAYRYILIGNIIALKDEKIIKVIENNEHEITLRPHKISLMLKTTYYYLLLILSAVIGGIIGSKAGKLFKVSKEKMEKL